MCRTNSLYSTPVMGFSSMPLDPVFPFKRLLDIIHWRGAFMPKYMYTAVQSSSDHTIWSTNFTS